MKGWYVFFLCEESMVKMFTVDESQRILLMQMQGTATLQLDTAWLRDTDWLLATMFSSS